ncbi:MAG: ShlB/FhaC/HecB family hemolysin secretion/activation protein [Desulfuromonadaceae bacterium]|nr:ShlB/FhaC/HecB family hemolysin secretion/activation protein [Desulfuromonadaceae bacterium]MDD2848535.1 ShlB/FhaC/HecB family hemolysin secretion/activation protein [Desulfuromonadaceae bacterium]MDD4131563.1 ShlB/FhaC/HecB family hemolysin secretion/activation protein [Desulfuromonadaceae bacterium]
MKYMRSEFIKSTSIVSAFILSAACSAAYAADGAGGVLQQLEKTDTMYKFKNQAPPVVEKEDKKPSMEQQPANVRVFVKRFRLEGNTLISEKELLSGIKLGSGKDMTLDEIKSVADMITARYRAKGFLIVNAYVPSQSIFDGATIIKSKSGFHIVNAFGAVMIKVVEGKVGTVSVTGNDYYKSSFIEGYLNTVRKDPSLKEEALERALLLLGEYESLSVKATLKAGTEFGTTDIIATVTDKFPLSGTVAYDNFGVKSTSKNRLSASLNVGNSITSGDVLKLNGIIGLDDLDPGRLSYGRAEYIVPVGVFGTQVGAYYSNTVYSVGGVDPLATLGLNGKAHVAGIYATHPLIKKRSESLTIRFGGEYTSLHDNLLGSTQDKDEIRKMVTGISYESTDRFLGRNFVGFGYAQGIGALLGGTEKGALNPSPSYLGADNMFSKFNLDAMRLQKLPGYNYLTAKGSFQYSPDRLFSAERMQLGGEGSVRGFKPASVSGDSAYFTSLELLLSPLYPEAEIFGQKVGNTLKFALFTDYGGVINTSPRPSEITSAKLSSIGAGLRLYGGSTLYCKLDWALPGEDGGYSGFKVDNSRIYFQTVVSF